MTDKNLRNNVMAFIFDESARILIWKYNSPKPSWTFPKWWLNENEDEIEWLFREIREELDIQESELELVHVHHKPIIKYFTDEEIEWKIKNKWEYFIWKSEKVFMLEFIWNTDYIDTSKTNELSGYKFISFNELKDFMKEDIINFLLEQTSEEIMNKHLEQKNFTIDK